MWKKYSNNSLVPPHACHQLGRTLLCAGIPFFNRLKADVVVLVTDTNCIAKLIRWG